MNPVVKCLLNTGHHCRRQYSLFRNYYPVSSSSRSSLTTPPVAFRSRPCLGPLWENRAKQRMLALKKTLACTWLVLVQCPCAREQVRATGDWLISRGGVERSKSILQDWKWSPLHCAFTSSFFRWSPFSYMIFTISDLKTTLLINKDWSIKFCMRRYKVCLSRRIHIVMIISRKDQQNYSNGNGQQYFLYISFELDKFKFCFYVPAQHPPRFVSTSECVNTFCLA